MVLGFRDRAGAVHAGEAKRTASGCIGVSELGSNMQGFRTVKTAFERSIV